MSRRIVVGIDGSEAAAAALRWAVEEARIRGSRLEVVHGWHVPSFLALPVAPSDVSREALQEAAERLIGEAIKEANVDDIDVEPVAVGAPGPMALIERSKGADLLVVGARGSGGFRGLRLGSVSEQVVHDAHCPVVVVHGEER
jgi:nucleotide-binding universal stress UspA family protein